MQYSDVQVSTGSVTLPSPVRVQLVQWGRTQQSSFCLCAGTSLGSCPVCHDVLGSELVMLPCGHQLCCKCSMTLIDRAPATASPEVSQHNVQVPCTCAAMVMFCPLCAHHYQASNSPLCYLRLRGRLGMQFTVCMQALWDLFWPAQHRW